MYGYEIAATVHADTDGAFTWREGSLYPNLHKMQADGLIVGEWEEKETGRKRRYYRITKKGRTALAEKSKSWSDLSAAVNRVLDKSDGQASAVSRSSVPDDRRPPLHATARSARVARASARRRGAALLGRPDHERCTRSRDRGFRRAGASPRGIGSNART